jgi:hypothetical protein
MRPELSIPFKQELVVLVVSGGIGSRSPPFQNPGYTYVPYVPYDILFAYNFCISSQSFLGYL